MITYIKKDITTVEQGLIIHGCNTMGKMGSAVALAIRNKWPQVYLQYQHYVNFHKEEEKPLLGQYMIVPITNELYVANCFTQKFYGNDGKKYASVDAIEQSLKGVLECRNNSYQLFDIYMPPIGCGLGGLSWIDEVCPVVTKLHDEFNKQNNFTIYICDK